MSWQNVENRNLQEYLGLQVGTAGILVTQVVAGSSADGFLESGDVIHAIDDVAVAGDGTCTPWDDQRLAFSVLVSRRQVGEVVRVSVTRRSEAMTVDVPLRKYTALVKPTYPDQVDGYFILGGVVFQRVTPAYLEAWTLEKIDDHLRYHARCVLPTSDRSELVVVSQVLAHESNVGYHDVHNAVVQRVNGTGDFMWSSSTLSAVVSWTRTRSSAASSCWTLTSLGARCQRY